MENPIDEPVRAMDVFGNIFWLNSTGRLHGQPGYISNTGDKFYYDGGFLHRLDGPAVEYATGYSEWHVNGKQLDPLEVFLLQGKQKD